MSAVTSLAERRAAPGPTPAKASVLAFVSDKETVDIVCRVVPGGRRGVEVREGGVAAALPALQQGKAPELLIVDVSDAGDPVADVATVATACGPATTLLVLGRANDVGLYRALLGAGATDYLVKPVTAQELRRTILTASRAEDKPEQTTRGRVSVVLGARGGVGSSSVAIGAAWLLSQTYKKRVVIVDLDLQYGTVALSLDLEPGSGLRSALENPDRIDALFVASALQNVSETLFVLGGEEPLEEKFSIQPEALDRLFAELKRIFDVIIVDLPRHQMAAAASLLAGADSIAVVTDLSLAGLRDTLRVRTGLGRIAPDTKPSIVANRVGLEKACELSVKEFERGLGGKIDFTVVEEAKAAKATLNGKPLAASMKGKRSGASLDGIARVLGSIETTRKSRNWFSLRS